MALHRGSAEARKIGMRLSGGTDLLEPFPAKPKGMLPTASGPKRIAVA